MNLLGLIAPLLLADPTITMDHDQLTAQIGQTLTVESVVSNSGPGIAHLNVVSLDGVYVDRSKQYRDDPKSRIGVARLDLSASATFPDMRQP